MPLFECSKCGVAENTALCNYWSDVGLEGKPALCSECNPEIARWHGAFPRRPATELRAKGVEFIEIKDWYGGEKKTP
jgi:hypothetical protein